LLKARFLKTCLIFLVLLGLFPASGKAQGKFPAPQGYVSDYARVLSPRAKSALSGLLQELERKTKAEVAIAILPDLGGNALEPYAVELFEHWKIGKKGKDNGLLILLAIKERKARIEVGYGLEGIIPDGLAGEIIRKMTPFFKQGDYDSGLLQATSFIASAIAHDAGVKLEVPRAVPHAAAGRRGRPPSAARSLLSLIFLVILIILFIKNPRLFFFFMLGSMLGGGRRGHWSGGGGGFGGGFGGFGGGMSGGGGASGGW